LSYVVTPGYAEALRLRLMRGRLLDERDLASGSQSLLVNEQFVRTFLQDAEPIGLRLPASVVTDKVDTSEIIGVVANVLKDSLDQQPQPELYVTTAHGAAIRREVNVVLRTVGDPGAYANDLRRIVAELRSDAALDGVAPLTAQVADSVAQPRFTAAVLLAFAVLALLLAAVGMYGVLSYTVACRRREMGVRTALGASPTAIVWMVMREGMVVAMLGVAVGVATAAALTRLMQALLVGIEPLDPTSFLAAAGTVLVASLVSCGLPARSAAATDPAMTLRSD
jgi:putative ABC transport system permease protein